MIHAGPRHYKITVERYGLPEGGQEDAMGGRAKKWTKLLDAMASRNSGTGQERRAQDGETSEQTATFRILSSAKARTITPKDRLKLRGDEAIWDITSVVPVGLNEGHDITAKRNADG